MTKQERAAAIWKWGSRYPMIWPRWQDWARRIYREDRIERGVEG